MLRDFISLLFPNLCAACNLPLNKHEENLCLQCEYDLPKTKYHLEEGNPVEKMFWGKTKLHSAAAYYSYKKGDRVQKMIQQLKYKGNAKIGIKLGELYGRELIYTPRFNTSTIIIPVPLHPKKLKIRGYNQSDKIADGLGKSMKIKIDITSLTRTRANETQTKKSLYERHLNVEALFKINNPADFENQHILLVDDVVTTGSTIISCVEAFSEVKNLKISVVAIAAA